MADVWLSGSTLEFKGKTVLAKGTEYETEVELWKDDWTKKGRIVMALIEEIRQLKEQVAELKGINEIRSSSSYFRNGICACFYASFSIRFDWSYC